MRISDWSSDVCSSDLSRNILRHSSAVLADEHEDGADHGLFAVHAARTGAQVTPDPDIGDLADGHGHTATRRRNRVPDLLDRAHARIDTDEVRSEEHTSELQSLMRISSAVSCLKKKTSDT